MSLRRKTHLLANGALEEALAALAADRAIMPTRRLVAAHHADLQAYLLLLK